MKNNINTHTSITYFFQIPSNEIFVDLDVYSKNNCDDDEEELIRRRNTSRRRAKSINPMHNTAERRQIQQVKLNF